MVTTKLQFKLALIATILTLVVVVLGAYVRLSHAGLGCPDWPGCYGQLIVPIQQSSIEQAQTQFPERVLETSKAWKEMVHRYAAGALGLLVFAITFMAIVKSRSKEALFLPLILCGLIVLQAALGMWTVTLLLKPLVVTLHLLGGFATLSLLYWLMLRYSHWSVGLPRTDKIIKRWVIVALCVLLLQVFLGGWTSSNYAALACYGFPTCNQQWWPDMQFSEAFVLWRGLGIDYEGGVLTHPARVAIQMLHRIGAVLVFLVFARLIFTLWVMDRRWVGKLFSAVIFVLLLIQIALGIVNVNYGLPLLSATAHNAVAALLLLSLITLLFALNNANERLSFRLDDE